MDPAAIARMRALRAAKILAESSNLKTPHAEGTSETPSVVAEAAGHLSASSLPPTSTSLTSSSLSSLATPSSSLSSSLVSSNGPTVYQLEPRRFGRHETEGYLDFDSFTSASSDKPLDPSNRGYKLLLKMGWKSGCGIGKVGNEGMVAPIATTIHANDSSLGLGKALQYSAVLDETASETAEKRRRLQEGDANSHQLKLEQEAKFDEIKTQKKVELQAFFCDWCNKGYKSSPEWEVHLQSYGHTHTRNMKELRASEAVRRNAVSGLTAQEKRGKEARREERLLAKRMKAAGASNPTSSSAHSSSSSSSSSSTSSCSGTASAEGGNMEVVRGASTEKELGDSATSSARFGSVGYEESAGSGGGGGGGGVSEAAAQESCLGAEGVGGGRRSGCWEVSSQNTGGVHGGGGGGGGWGAAEDLDAAAAPSCLEATPQTSGARSSAANTPENREAHGLGSGVVQPGAGSAFGQQPTTPGFSLSSPLFTETEPAVAAAGNILIGGNNALPAVKKFGFSFKKR